MTSLVFLYQHLPQPNVFSQLATPSYYTEMSFNLLSFHPTQSLSPCPWPLWVTQIVAKNAYFQTQWPPCFFIPTPTQTKCIQTTPNTIPLHGNVIQSSLLLPHPISEPLSLTPLNGSNSSKNAYFQNQWPPWFFYTNRVGGWCVELTGYIWLV